MTFNIPQQPPFRMIDDIVRILDTGCVTSLVVSAGNPLVENGFLSEAGLIENVAQTCAAWQSVINERYDGGLQLKPQIGVIGSVRDCEISSLPLVGDTVITEVNVLQDFGTMQVIEGRINLNDNLIVRMQMTIALI